MNNSNSTNIFSYFCKVKKALPIIFLTIFLIANTAFGELLRLPTLVEHYFEHIEEENSYSLSEFLYAHYTSGLNHADNSHKDHQKLPFKSMNCHAFQVVMLITLIFVALSFSQLILIEITISNRFHRVFSNQYLNNIWQPPRI